MSNLKHNVLCATAVCDVMLNIFVGRPVLHCSKKLYCQHAHIITISTCTHTRTKAVTFIATKCTKRHLGVGQMPVMLYDSEFIVFGILSQCCELIFIHLHTGTIILVMTKKYTKNF